MEKEISFNEFDSLNVIRQMIDTAKQEQKDDGKGWILWGWMLLVASVLTILNIQFLWFNTFFFWNIFGAFTLLMALYQIIKGVFFKKKIKVKTYTSEIFDKLNTGFFISLMLIIVSINVGVTPRFGFALLMNLYGFWILIYASVLNFRPSMIGAYIMWALALTGLFVSTFQSVMIIHAIGVFCGYIVPGYIAKKRFKELKGEHTSNEVKSV